MRHAVISPPLCRHFRRQIRHAEVPMLSPIAPLDFHFHIRYAGLRVFSPCRHATRLFSTAKIFAAATGTAAASQRPHMDAEMPRFATTPTAYHWSRLITPPPLRRLYIDATRFLLPPCRHYATRHARFRHATIFRQPCIRAAAAVIFSRAER